MQEVRNTPATQEADFPEEAGFIGTFLRVAGRVDAMLQRAQAGC